MKALTIGSLSVAPGSKSRMVLGSVHLPSGITTGIPCIVANGVEEGPTLVISGATHGNEIAGTAATIELMRTLDPQRMRGAVIAIPVANPLALDQGSYVTPQDGRNMASRIYWGANPNGTMTERLGAILSPIYQRADYYIDIHGNHEPAAPMCMLFLSCSRDADVREKTIKLGNAFGVTPVDMSDPVAHPAWVGSVDQYPVPVALANGTPALMVELVSSHTVLDASRGRKGVMNVMKELKMMEGSREAQEPAALPGRYHYWGSLAATAAGLAWPRVAPGRLVAKGDPVIDITDLWGDVLETLKSPAEGFLWSINGALYGDRTHAVPEGSDLGFFAERVS
jgi:predicted deacylase